MIYTYFSRNGSNKTFGRRYLFWDSQHLSGTATSPNASGSFQCCLPPAKGNPRKSPKMVQEVEHSSNNLLSSPKTQEWMDPHFLPSRQYGVQQAAGTFHRPF